MTFVYSPVLLFVSSTGFDLWEFTYAGVSCILGVAALSIAVVGYFLTPISGAFRFLMALSGLVFIVPSLGADLLALAAPVLIVQLVSWRTAGNRA